MLSCSRTCSVATWKFAGYVVSDCDAVADIERGHHFTPTMAEAAAISLKRGTDNDCADFGQKATDNNDYVKYVDAVKEGFLSEKDVDVTLKRLFTARFKLGLFDPPSMVKYAQTPDSEIDNDAHRQLALKIARESMVLLKNDGALPLKASREKSRWSGRLAASLHVLEGNYSGTPSRSATALDGIRKQFAAAQVSFTPGTNFLLEDTGVPSSALSTPDGKSGLKAEYFSDAAFKGAADLVKVEQDVNYDFAPGTVTKTKIYSVRWTGFLTPPESGTYRLGLDGSLDRLWLDGKMIVDDPKSHDSRPAVAEVALEKGRRYRLKIEYFQGRARGVKLVWTRLSPDPLGDAVAAAKQSDVVVAVVGITSNLEGEEMEVAVPGFKGGDRTSLALPKGRSSGSRPENRQTASGRTHEWQRAFGELGEPERKRNFGRMVLRRGRRYRDRADAGGSEQPGGAVPVTFYKGVEQLPPFEEYSMKNRTYRYFEGQPLYPFGYGLSYSKFEYTNLKLSASTLSAGDPLTVDADVKNASQRDGDEVVQLFLSFPKSPTNPIHALRGLTRIHLAGGETRHVSFKLDARDLSGVDDNGDRFVAAGSYRITVGGGQPGTGASQADAEFAISGEQRLPD